MEIVLNLYRFAHIDNRFGAKEAWIIRLREREREEGNRERKRVSYSMSLNAYKGFPAVLLLLLLFLLHVFPLGEDHGLIVPILI